MPGRRELNKEDKRRRIRDAAWSLFREHGFDATTTRAIAERAEIGVGTLFLYAPDKDALLFSLFRDELGDIVTKRFARVPERALLDQLLYVIRGFYERYAEDPALARRFVPLILRLEGDALASYAALNADFFARVGALVEAAKTRGEVRADVDGAVLGVNVLAIYAYFVLGWLLGPAPRVKDGLASLKPALASLLDGVRPVKAGVSAREGRRK